MQNFDRVKVTNDSRGPDGAASPPVMSRLKTPQSIRWTIGALLSVHAGLLAYGAVVHSPTYNEPAHLMAGISYWQFGRMDIYSVNPPLVRLIAAAPVMLAGCETDWKGFHEGPGARPEWAMGRDFSRVNGYRTFWLMTIARWACIPFSLIGGYICFRWGRELYGASAGVLSLVLWCFCPNIIGHGQLITSDVAATAFGMAACYTFWHWLKQPTWWNASTSGIVLGVAELTKTTLVIFYPLWPVLWFIYRWPDRRSLAARDWLREFGMICVRVLIGLYVINFGYGFERSFMRLGDYTFVSDTLTGVEDHAEPQARGNRFAGSWLGKVPVPLPKNYVLGIDLQRKDFESNDQDAYLGGSWSENGWWYYYLYALAIKVPVGTWLLMLIAIGARLVITVPARYRDEFYLLAPALVILSFVSSQTGMNEHMRYVLPIFPFFFIWMGRVAPAVVAVCAGLIERNWKKGSIVGMLAMAGLLWSVCSSLWHYPHSLAYFNEIVGGPKNGWKYLLQSNVDWGQDLLYLKQWINEHPEAKPLGISYFGAIEPALADIPFNAESKNRLLIGGEVLTDAGWLAVSATLLAGYDHGQFRRDTFLALREIPVHEIVGGSILIFRPCDFPTSVNDTTTANHN